MTPPDRHPPNVPPPDRIPPGPRLPPGQREHLLAVVGRAALDFVVSAECAGCGRPGRVWCPACEVASQGACRAVPGPIECRAAAPHAGPVGRAVVAFKDQGARRLAAPLGRLLAAAVRDVLDSAGAPVGQPVWLVPIPARRSARRERGADHMAVLAGQAARVLRAQGIAANRLTALHHVRASRDQLGLSRPQRRANVAGTLAAQRLPSGLVVVVDDVTTTGATLAEAARALAVLDGRVPLAATLTWASTTWPG